MNKETYLQDLRKALKILPQSDRDEAIEFYEEYFEEAGPENEAKVIEELGAPKSLAKKILVDVVDRKYESIVGSSKEMTTIDAPVASTTVETADGTLAVVPAPVEENGAAAQQAQIPQQQIPQQQEQPKEKTSSMKTLWIVLAAIFALPLSPVVFALLIVICVLIFVVFITLISLVAAFGGICLGGLVTVVLGLIALFIDPAAALLILGSGLSMIGIGIFITIGCVALIRLVAKGLATFFGKVVHKKNRKNKAMAAQTV